MYFWPLLLESFIIAPPCWHHGLTLHYGAKWACLALELQLSVAYLEGSRQL